MAAGQIDLTKMERVNAGILRGAEAGSVVVAAELGGAVARLIAERSKQDTGRYVRAWQEAHNQLPGISPIPLTPLRPSRYYVQQESRLRQQLSKWEPILRMWEARVSSMEKHPNHQRWLSYRKTVRTRDKVRALVERAREEEANIRAAASGAAIVIGGKKTKSPLAKSSLTRVITRFYGGRARIVKLGGAHLAEVANLEPHARIVAQRTGLVRASIAAVRRLETERVTRKYLARIRSTAGVGGVVIRGGG